ncbi:F0F1 ATP synthase subunit B [Paenibacillus flagellatus]|uniref:ATP synthase subunit b n=1 Tax=Paenibacillus flagellatus TaxID=2211139 RepID=A0A2V5JWY5_9BACL|nr:F0F1 ATP synthase subunit B [Paenibacillus flagellatus]PYI51131.1 ATP synthase F0 subunit B [Paenibacillus flagellatus]
MAFHWESFVFAIIAFLALYFLLNKYAFGPLFGIMEKRREQVQNQIQSAEQNRAEAAKLLEEQKKAIQDARKEAYELIEQARTTSVRQADEIIQQAKDEAVRIKNDAMKDIESEKNKAIVALRSQVSALSVLIASKIIEKQLDEKSQHELIDQYLKEVGGNV